VTPTTPQQRRLTVLSRIRDIRTGPDNTVDIIADDETGAKNVIRLGPD
jgi:hypothetical protein